MNAINHWCLLYRSEQLSRCGTQTERQVLLAAILKTNTHTWHHVNLQEEYDFSDSYNPVTALFNLHELMSLSLTRPAPK